MFSIFWSWKHFLLNDAVLQSPIWIWKPARFRESIDICWIELKLKLLRFINGEDIRFAKSSLWRRSSYGSAGAPLFGAWRLSHFQIHLLRSPARTVQFIPLLMFFSRDRIQFPYFWLIWQCRREKRCVRRGSVIWKPWYYLCDFFL